MVADNSTLVEDHEVSPCSLTTSDRDCSDTTVDGNPHKLEKSESEDDDDDDSVQLSWGFVNTDHSADSSTSSNVVVNGGMFNPDRPNSSSAFLLSSPPIGLSSPHSNYYSSLPPSILGRELAYPCNQVLPGQWQHELLLQHYQQRPPALSLLELVAPSVSSFGRRDLFDFHVVTTRKSVAPPASGMNSESFTSDQFSIKHSSTHPYQDCKSSDEAMVVVKKPKRVLTAYNIFFRDQRQLMLAEKERRIKGARSANRKVTTSGKSAMSMAKTIAKKWKNVDAETLAKYKKKEKEDSERFAREHAEYKKYEMLKLEAKRAAMERAVPDEVKQRYFGY